MQKRSSFRHWTLRSCTGLLLLGTLVGCKKSAPEDAKKNSPAPAATSAQSVSDEKSADPVAQASAKEVRKLASVLPKDELVQPVVNPRKLEPYTGPTGTVRGVVRATGDTAPELPDVVAKMDRNCTTSKSTFGRLFREGKDRQLADVLVAVTGYEGYVPKTTENVDVEAEGCAWDRRTVALTYGQRVSIVGKDNRPYVPEILGQPTPAQLFVLPTAPVVDLAPQRPGRFKLVDSMRLYNVAELFVVPYRTVDVTDLEGSFEISGIPVGDVTVNALLPQTGVVGEKKVTVEEGKTTTIEFELAFDRSAWDATPKPPSLDEVPAPNED